MDPERQVAITKKRILSLLLMAALLASLPVGMQARAADAPQYTPCADALHQMGLFAGVGDKALEVDLIAAGEYQDNTAPPLRDALPYIA